MKGLTGRGRCCLKSIWIRSLQVPDESLDDYEQLKRVNNARRKTQSQFIRSELMDNVREYSNGESAFLYFTEKVTENALFLLDEPENSLSPAKQQELVKFIEDSARFLDASL